MLGGLTTKSKSTLTTSANQTSSLFQAPCIPAILLGLASVSLIFYYGDGSRAAKGAQSLTRGTGEPADVITFVAGGSMHGGVSVHRVAGASQRGRPNVGRV
jgi:hypothetical protein